VALCPGLGFAIMASPPLKVETFVFFVVLLYVVKTKSVG
jgi:hypothetical protein